MVGISVGGLNDHLWVDLEKAMGGPGKKVKIGWPVVLLLGTKC